MPGPVSDSFDPEFGTGENARIVADAIRGVLKKVEVQANLSSYLLNIVGLALDDDGLFPRASVDLSEREWRILRFAVLRALETL